MILLLLATVPFVFDPFLELRYHFRYAKETLMNVMVILMMIPFLFEIFLNPLGRGQIVQRIAKSPLFAPFLLLVVASFISLSKSSIFLFNLRDFLSLFCGFLLFILTIHNLKTGFRIDWVVLIVLLVGLVMGFYCIFQYLGFDPIFKRSLVGQGLFKKGFMKVAGFIDNPNTLSGFLAFIPLLAIADLLRKKRMSERIVPFLSFLFSVTGIILASALSGLFSLFVGTVVFVVLLLKSAKGVSAKYPRWIVLLLVMTFISGLLFTLLEPSLFNDLTKLREQVNPQKSLRLLIFKSTLYMIKENPLWGIGFGNFKVKYLDYRVLALRSKNFTGKWEYADYAHNDYLQIAAEAGFFALLALVWMILILIKLSYALIKKAQKDASPPDYLLIGLLASLVGSAVNALAVFPFHLASSALLAIVYGAIVSNKFDDFSKSHNLCLLP